MAAALLVVLGLVLLGVESGSGAGKDWERRAGAAGERGLGLWGPSGRGGGRYPENPAGGSIRRQEAPGVRRHPRGSPPR